MLKKSNKSLSISYIGLRRLIGILGMLLPIICIIGGILFSHIGTQQSISYYYHTNMRDFFVGLMFCVSLFLVTYKGYERIDIIASIAAGVFGMGLALFPCMHGDEKTVLIGLFQLPSFVSNIFHLIFALLFFVILALNSIFLFTKSDKTKPVSKKKIIRNRIYIVCGILMLSSIVILFLCKLIIPAQIVSDLKLVIIGETIMLFSFGISWLVKGKTLYKD